MEQIPYMDSLMSEEDWLYTPNMTDAWYVYYKPAMHLDVEEQEMFGGELPLSDVVASANAHMDEAYADGRPCVLVSGKPIERFYPEVKENEPREIVFYDGGAWYWARNCESGQYLDRE